MKSAAVSLQVCLRLRLRPKWKFEQACYQTDIFHHFSHRDQIFLWFAHQEISPSTAEVRTAFGHSSDLRIFRSTSAEMIELPERNVWRSRGDVTNDDDHASISPEGYSETSSRALAEREISRCRAKAMLKAGLEPASLYSHASALRRRPASHKWSSVDGDIGHLSTVSLPLDHSSEGWIKERRQGYVHKGWLGIGSGMTG